MEYQINKYDVVQTGRYGGKFQVKLGYFDKAGNFKPRFSLNKDREGNEKFIPVTFIFDDDETAIAVLERAIDEIKTKEVPF